MSSHHFHPQPLKKKFFTPGTFVLMVLMGIGTSFGLARLLTGLQSVTNLNNSYPWGIWIAIDVACGVALAAGGFTTAALVDIFGGKKYHPLLRPAVLTAWLGYIMVAIGLMFDLGRYWNIWQPMFHWQGNSVMFELAMCVMAYLIVLTFEIAPSILEGLKERIAKNEWGASLLKKVEKPVLFVHSWIKIILPIFVIAGVVLSSMHQSSLGTVMVISPTKLSTLWYTPWLPLLFLLSAIMVGFPMVILESISSSKGLKRPVEIELLEPLSSKIPIFIGVYAWFKFGDLAFRLNELNFMEYPGATVAFAIEIIMGIIVPFILLSMKSVRRSKGWLLTSCLLVIFGVALNRINVFLVGYHPTFAKINYYPAVGEIALTIGLIAFLIFLYRFFVNYFPILPAIEEISEAEPSIEEKMEKEGHVQPVTAWVFRGIAVVFLLTFIILYVVIHQKAIKASSLTYGEAFITKVIQPQVEEEKGSPHQFRPEKYRNYYMMNSPLLNEKISYYEPVRFSHRSHDNYVNGDCGKCHHRVGDSSNRIGDDLREMHASIEVKIGGSCSNCHKDLTEKTFQKCGDCHESSNEADYPTRIGLKGAYHRQCIGCHREQPPTTKAPVDCVSCHHPITPDHTELIKLAGNVSPQAITLQCLECHPKVGQDIMNSAHWNWKGLTPSISGHEHSITTGLLTVMDNYTISLRPDLVASSALHIGYSPKPGDIDFNNLRSIDCLVCHDTTGTYRKDENRGGLPVASVNLVDVAHKVGRPSRSNCGLCHYYAAGGPNYKHGDLEGETINADPEVDVHMGMAEMRCQECHKTSAHQIAGMSFNAPVTEGRVRCESCHSETPHGITGYLSRHLDDHVRTVSCETCHIPSFARKAPTLMSTDFSTAGQDRPIKSDILGMPDYNKNQGSLIWGKNVIPVYKWYNGTRKSYIMGDKIDSTDYVELNTPQGEKHIPESRIFPFKLHTAVQPYDTENIILVPVKFKDEFEKNHDWNKAITSAMKSVNLDYSGKFGFVKTGMYTSIHHEVVRAKEALGCADCHRVEAVSCKRCHKNAQGMDELSHTRMMYPEVKNRMDFKSLGYEDDPAIMGGRFYMKLGRGKPPE